MSTRKERKERRHLRDRMFWRALQGMTGKGSYHLGKQQSEAFIQMQMTDPQVQALIKMVEGTTMQCRSKFEGDTCVLNYQHAQQHRSERREWSDYRCTACGQAIEENDGTWWTCGTCRSNCPGVPGSLHTASSGPVSWGLLPEPDRPPFRGKAKSEAARSVFGDVS